MTLTPDQYKICIEKARVIVKDVEPDYKPFAFNVILRDIVDSYADDSSSSSPKDTQTSKKTASQPNKGGSAFQVKMLVDEQFFKDLKSMDSIIAELVSRSYHYKPSDLTQVLKNLTRSRVLRRSTKENDKGKKVLHWVNW